MVKIQTDLTIAKQIFNIMLADGTLAEITRGMPSELHYSNITTELIEDHIKENGNKFKPEVKWYRTWSPWSAAVATTYTGNYNYIGLNSRKSNRSLASLVGSIAHEWGHCLEYFVKSQNPGQYFNHGGNSPVGKDLTFQYILGRKAKEHVEKYEHEFLQRLGIRE